MLARRLSANYTGVQEAAAAVYCLSSKFLYFPFYRLRGTIVSRLSILLLTFRRRQIKLLALESLTGTIAAAKRLADGENIGGPTLVD